MIPPRPTRTVMLIRGMKDSAGRQALTDALESIPGVREVDVNLFRARACVLHDQSCPPENLIRAVLALGMGAIEDARAGPAQRPTRTLERR